MAAYDIQRVCLCEDGYYSRTLLCTPSVHVQRPQTGTPEYDIAVTWIARRLLGSSQHENTATIDTNSLTYRSTQRLKKLANEIRLIH